MNTSSICNWCNSEGFLFARHKFRDTGFYAFRCQCQNADKRDYEGRRLIDSRIPKWTEERNDKWIPEFGKDEPRHKAFLENREREQISELKEQASLKNWKHPIIVKYVMKHGKEKLLEVLNS